MGFYQVIKLPIGSIHGTVESSNRNEEECIEYFKKIRDEAVKNDIFEKDLNDKEFETTTHNYYCTYNNI